jgi:hypothetical protein
VRTVEIFAFSNSDGDLLGHYTSSDQSVTRLGVVYSPISIRREPMKVDGTIENESLGLVLAAPAGFVSELLSMHNSLQRAIVQAFSADLDLTTPVWVSVFSGVVSSAQLSGEADEIALTLEGSAGSLKQSAFRQTYATSCGHLLYGPQCRASRAAASTTLSRTIGTGPLIALGAGWSAARQPSDYLGGVATWLDGAGRTARRTIVGADATSIRLSTGWPAQTGLISVTLTMGCDKSQTSCQGRHNNIQNYGGCPFMPLQNPIGVRNNYQ